MALLNPAALWLLPLVALVVILARMRPEPLRRAIATLHLWTDAAGDEGSRAPSARPRINLLFILQVAFALLMVAALAHPQLRRTRRDVAIVVDLSASMNARDGSSTRLELARRRAAALARSWPSSADVHLVGAADAPVDLGRSRAGDLARAVSGIKAGTGGSDIPEAIQFANAAETVVISDQPAPPAAAGVRWIQVGHPVDNLAVTTLAARRLATPDGGAVLLAGISNYGATPHDTEVAFTRDGRDIARRRVHIAPRETTTATVAIPPGGGTFSAELPGNDDALAADDRRSLVLRSAVRVRWASASSTFVARALAANPDVTVENASGAADILVCACGTLPEGSTPVLMLPPAASQSTPPAPLTADVNAHPLLDGIDLDNLTARAMTASAANRRLESSAVILRAGTQPVLSAAELNGRRIVEMDLDSEVAPGSTSNLALTPAFPILVANIVDWLSMPADAAGVPGTESDLRAFPPPAADTAGLASTESADSGMRDLFTMLLIAALAVYAAEWWLTWRARRTWKGSEWRIAVAALLIAAAAGLSLPSGEGSTSLVAVLDHSDSIGNAAFRASLSRVNQFAGAMHDDDRLGVVVFGGDAAIERRPGGRSPISGVRSAVTGSSTNIEEALRLARTTLPDTNVRRLVLFSDGRETSGNAAREAARAAAAGVRVDVAVPDSAASGASSLAIAGVSAPPDVREGEPFAVAVNVTGSPGMRGRVMMFRDGMSLDTREVRIGADGTSSVRISDSRAEPGHVTYEAALDDDDGNRQGAVVNVSGRSRVLYVGDAAGVASALESSGLRVARVTPADFARAAQPLTTFDLVVLDAVAADRLTPAQAQSVVSYVNDGGGLLLIGSRATLTAAHVAGTRLDPILPVDLRPRRGLRAPAESFVFVFDKSGSMADREHGVQKIELARQAVLRVLDVRQSSDPFGVVAFDRTPTAVATLAAGHDAAAVAERLRAIEPGGATAIAPAIDMAIGWLKSSPTPKRHLLLVSDGRTTAADADRLREAVRGQGVELSVIAIGPDADRDLLDRLARSTGGRSYAATDIRDLPALAARDATAAAGGTEVDELFTLAVSPHPATAGLDRAALPRLRGYTVSALRPGAEPMLVSPLGDPILAGWRAGLGRVAVFTSDLQSSWAADMPAWKGFRQLWTQTARWTARGTESRELTPTVSDRSNHPHLVIEAEHGGRFASALDLDATVLSPSGGTDRIRLRATAPGRYETDLPAAATGAYVLDVSGRDRETGVEERTARAFYWSANRERSSRGADTLLLSQIARVTGGEMLPAAANPFNGSRPRQWRDVSTWLGAGALILFVADLARRRRALNAFIRWWRTRAGSTSAAAAHI